MKNFDDTLDFCLRIMMLAYAVSVGCAALWLVVFIIKYLIL